MNSRADWNREAAQWAETAAAKLKAAGDEAKRDYQERADEGIGDNEPAGQRLLDVQLWDNDLDKLTSGLRELAAYLRETAA